MATLYTHAFEKGRDGCYYWAITVPGDSSEFYADLGYKTLVNEERSCPCIYEPETEETR